MVFIFERVRRKAYVHTGFLMIASGAWVIELRNRSVICIGPLYGLYGCWDLKRDLVQEASCSQATETSGARHSHKA